MSNIIRHIVRDRVLRHLVRASVARHMVSASPRRHVVRTSTAPGGVVVTPPVNTTAPSITASPEIGETVAIDYGAWDNAPDSYAVTVLRDGVVIPSADESYVYAASDIGPAITVSVVASNAAGDSDAVTSAAVEWSPVSLSFSKIVEPRLCRAWQERTGRTTLAGVGDPVGEIENVGTLGGAYSAAHGTDTMRPTLQSDHLDCGTDDELRAPIDPAYLGASQITDIWVGRPRGGGTTAPVGSGGNNFLYAPTWISKADEMSFYVRVSPGVTTRSEKDPYVPANVLTLDRAWLGESDVSIDPGYVRHYSEDWTTPDDSSTINGVRTYTHSTPGYDYLNRRSGDSSPLHASAKIYARYQKIGILTATQKTHLGLYLTHHYGVST